MAKLNPEGDGLPLVYTCRQVHVGARLYADRMRVGITDDGEKFILPLDEMKRSERQKQFCWPRDDGGEYHPVMVEALKGKGVDVS